MYVKKNPLEKYNQRRPYRQIDTRRRSTLTRLVTGSAINGAAAALPSNWTQPVVDSVLLPAHAQTSSPPQAASPDSMFFQGECNNDLNPDQFYSVEFNPNPAGNTSADFTINSFGDTDPGTPSVDNIAFFQGRRQRYVGVLPHVGGDH